MSDTKAMADVRKAGKKFARAQAARDAARDELLAAIRTADAEGGHSRTSLVEASGLAKQTVYDALEGRAADTAAARAAAKAARLAERRERLAAELAEVDASLASTS